MTSTTLADRGGCCAGLEDRALTVGPLRRSSDRTFLAVLAVLFAASTAVTVAWCGSMAAMGGMEMPGDWTMSMAWMRMPDRTWVEAAAAFVGMWTAMMVAMMLPSLAPMLSRYRSSLRQGGAARLGPPTTVAGLGYFAVWTAVGLAVYPLGVALADLEMRYDALARLVPFAGGCVVLAAGALQLTAWKARSLACCRGAHALAALPSDLGTAWRRGIRIGLDCARCCGVLMTVLLVVDVMDLAAMALVTVAITAERIAPAGDRVARGVGILTVACGLVVTARALGRV
jgi:predicted metal-binding membrane protein